jgi:hypothetical protein
LPSWLGVFGELMVEDQGVVVWGVVVWGVVVWPGVSALLSAFASWACSLLTTANPGIVSTDARTTARQKVFTGFIADLPLKSNGS